MEFLEVYNINIVSLVLVIAFIYPVLMGVIFKLKSKSMVVTIKGVLTSIAMVCSIILTTVVVKNVFTLDKYGLVEYISSKISSSFAYLITKSKLFNGIILLITFLLIYQIFKALIEFISRIVLYPASDAIDTSIRNTGRGTRALLGGVFQIPKAICYVIILAALLSYASIFLKNAKLDSKLNSSNIYSYINEKIIEPVTDSEIAKSFPNILDNSFKVVDEENNVVDNVNGYLQGIVFYNGVTLDEGIRSNEIIDNTALSITSKYDNDYDKARALYEWIGNAIIYDDDKAKEVMNNPMPTGTNSGAINTFKTGKGVCFDYACLYVAMCRANGIPVRLIVGEGYNGTSWVSHSWNEVYIKDRDKWVNVDATFYNAGDYFDNDTFNSEHRGRKVAGEWN
ncbi:transglutaminase-like domain-containing protein [Clostridium sp.]|uniref:transglutaminase-like domain-containing protein n=1 Tax=Clostridium sp. TaxID=1506 RepID=UPI003217F325